MRKVLMAAALVALAACSNKEAEAAKMESLRLDSVRVADSVKAADAARVADSIRVADSMRVADSIAKATPAK